MCADLNEMEVEMMPVIILSPKTNGSFMDYFFSAPFLRAGSMLHSAVIKFRQFFFYRICIQTSRESETFGVLLPHSAQFYVFFRPNISDAMGEEMQVQHL